MKEDSEIICTNLEMAWNQVWNIFGPDNSWKNNQTKCTDIQKKLLHFNGKHSDDPIHIDNVIKALNRGVFLTLAAVKWRHPAIGQTPLTPIEKMRGVQWRLVIAYSGFEITFKTLMNCPSRRIKLEIVEDFISKCDLPTYRPLLSPNKKPNLEKWLNKEEGAIAKFLGIEGGDLKMINYWLVKSSPIDTWFKAVRLAKALRNASAHGFLVATKVNGWGLKPSLITLADNLAEITTASLNKLI